MNLGIAYNSSQNTLEDLHNLMLATGTNNFATVADTSFIGKSALDSSTNWASLLGGSNDDAGVSLLIMIIIVTGT